MHRALCRDGREALLRGAEAGRRVPSPSGGAAASQLKRGAAHSPDVAGGQQTCRVPSPVHPDGPRRADKLGGSGWLSRLVQLSDAKVPVLDLVRVPLGIVLPLGAGLAVEAWAHNGDGLSAGVLASIGALVGSIAPQRGPPREKVARTAAGVALGAAGLAVGRYAVGGGWQVVVLVTALAAVAALVSAISANVSFGALQFLVYIAVGSGVLSSLPEGETVALFLAGGIWAMLLTVLWALAERTDPDRAVVKDVLDAVGRLLRASGSGEYPLLRQAVTDALNRAYDQVARSRSSAAGRSPRLARLAGILNGMQPLVDGAVALYRAGQHADPDDVRALGTLADAVMRGGKPPGPAPPALEEGSAAGQGVRDGVRLLWDVVAGHREVPAVRSGRTTWRATFSDLVSRTVGSPASREFAARLALCMGIAEVVREHLPYERPYWVLLTVAIVLKPDFGSVFVRGVQRTAGTLVGVVLGAGMIALVPHDGWMLIPMVLAASVMRWAQAANYGLFVVSLTPLVVMLLDIAAPGDAGVVTARLVDTVIGSAIVILFGYLLWPRTWRSTFDAPLRNVVLALDTFVEVTFGTPGSGWRPARRRTFRALTELQTALQRQLGEPPPMGTRAARWWPFIVQLERTADAVIEAGVALDAGEARPDEGQVAAIRRIVRGLAEPPTTSPPGVPEGIATGVLGPVAQEVATACRLRSEIERHPPLPQA